MILVDICGDFSCANVINDTSTSWLVETRISHTPIEIPKNSTERRICKDMHEAMSWIKNQRASAQ